MTHIINWLNYTMPFVFLTATCMLQTWFLVKLRDRITKIESCIYLRDWLDAINRGESLSDLAYMKEKGFLK